MRFQQLLREALQIKPFQGGRKVVEYADLRRIIRHFSKDFPHSSHPEHLRASGNKCAFRCGGEDHTLCQGPGLVTRHIESGNRPQIYDLIELWVKIGIGLGGL